MIGATGAYSLISIHPAHAVNLSNVSIAAESLFGLKVYHFVLNVWWRQHAKASIT